MSLKAFLLLFLVAAAAASPAPAPAPAPAPEPATSSLLPIPILQFPILGDILNLGNSVIGQTIGDLFRVVVGVNHTARDLLSDILSLRIRSFDDCLNLGFKVTLGLADCVNASISGFGTLIAKMVLVIFRIGVCFGGYGNSVICPASLNTQVGVQATVAVNIQAMIQLFGVADCKAQVQTYINTCTNGQGIGAARGSLGVVFKIAVDLAQLIDAYLNAGGVVGKAELTYCFRRIDIFLGVIGNSRQSGSGLIILNNWIPTCDKYLVSAGCPAIGAWSDIQLLIALGNNDNAPWAIIDVNAQTSTGATVSLSLGQLVSNIFRGVIGVTRLSATLVQDILNISLNSFDACINLAVKIVLGLGGLLDVICSGLGTLFVRIVGGLLKIVLCFFGTGKYGACQPGWNAQFGVNVEVTSIAECISAFGIGTCRNDVALYIRNYGSATGFVQCMFSSATTLSLIVDAGKWDNSIVVTIFTHLTYMLGALGNSNSAGVGTAVCNQFIPACNKWLTAAGFIGFGSSQTSIISVVTSIVSTLRLWSADINTDRNTELGFIFGTGVSVGGSTSISVGGLLGGLFQVLRGVTIFVSTVITDILNFKLTVIANVFTLMFKRTVPTFRQPCCCHGRGKTHSQTVFPRPWQQHGCRNVGTVPTQVVLGLGGAIETTISGLGSLFIRCVAVIIKIGVCFNGYPGDTSICNNQAWNAQFGIVGEASTAAELIVIAKLTNVQIEFDACVSAYTNGLGIESTTGAAKIILQQCNSLIIYITDYTQINKNTMPTCFIAVTTILGAIANANQQNSGTIIIQKLYPACGTLFTGSGYIDITVYISTTVTLCLGANGDTDNWTPGTQPVTEPPVTLPPVTQPPVTKPPVTLPPVTLPPVTLPPVTQPPVTQPPVTKPPVTLPPVTYPTLPPVTLPPVTLPPVTQPPVTKPPVTLPPVTYPTLPPVTQPPVTKPPVTLPPVTYPTLPPVTQPPVTKPPVTLPPVTLPPVTQPPVTQAPVTQPPGNGGGVDVGGLCGGILKIFTGVFKFAADIIIQIINIKLTTINNLFNLIIRVAIAIGGIIDSLFLGLGSLFVRLIAVIFKIGICINGYPGDQSICTPEWNALFGINGDASTVVDLITLFRLPTCQTDILTIKASIGTKATASVSIVIQVVQNLAAIVSSKVITKQHFSTCFTSVFTCVGVIANSNSNGSGTTLIQQILPTCNQLYVGAGFPALTLDINTIYVSDSAQINWRSGVAINIGGSTTVTANGNSLVTFIKNLFSNVKDQSNINTPTVTAVLNIDIPTSFDGVCNFGINIMLAIGNIINVFIANLGTLLIRLFGFLLRYIVCVVGASRNSNCFVCQQAYFDAFGVSVTGNTWVELVAGFQLTTVQSDLDQIYASFEAEVGAELVGSERICFDQAYALVDVFNKQSQIVDSDMTAVFTCCISLIGGFANSWSVNLGTQIATNMVPVCGTYLVANKYPDLTPLLPAITSSVQRCNNDHAVWAQSTIVN